MRKIPAALAILGLATVGLAGCSLPGSSSDCPRSASDDEVLSLVEVTGSTDAAPDVEVYTPFHTDSAAFGDVEQGDGVVITSDDQLVVVDVTLVSGETGETLVATPYDGDLTRAYPLSQWTQTFPSFAEALDCTAEGSRVVIALAPGDVEPETAASLGLAEDESAIAVVDVRKVYLAAADGTNQFNSGNGLPTVVRAPDGRPGLIVPDGSAPEEIVVETIKKGDGPEITGDVPVRAHMLAVSWDDKEQVKTTWDTQPESLPLAGDPVLAEALVGQTVGSQVMVVVPADQGGTDQATVFVFDLLGLDPAATQ
ncbi:hypothetical protein [Microbacterium sp. CFBP9034]|uniref:FKBP-type peptidyl-prolyl cis-trans isomerase n=1 Tax=Microbacterium sp. CFBP9034 TaxID=3096540 RepID=UPI002A6B3A3A|nr:hypothetical protein [Microbacterium sp. CFBP9034]MDY0909846.1 hypothetical protein [Microbacterium sp. CFBP9034]